MTGSDLDSILTQIDCPRCGAQINLPYRQLRIQKAAACKCGTLLRLVDETPVATVRRLIDATNLTIADND